MTRRVSHQHQRPGPGRPAASVSAFTQLTGCPREAGQQREAPAGGVWAHVLTATTVLWQQPASLASWLSRGSVTPCRPLQVYRTLSVLWTIDQDLGAFQSTHGRHVSPCQMTSLLGSPPIPLQRDRGTTVKAPAKTLDSISHLAQL